MASPVPLCLAVCKYRLPVREAALRGRLGGRVRWCAWAFNRCPVTLGIRCVHAQTHTRAHDIPPAASGRGRLCVARVGRALRRHAVSTRPHFPEAAVTDSADTELAMELSDRGGDLRDWVTVPVSVTGPRGQGGLGRSEPRPPSAPLSRAPSRRPEGRGQESRGACSPPPEAVLGSHSAVPPRRVCRVCLQGRAGEGGAGGSSLCVLSLGRSLSPDINSHGKVPSSSVFFQNFGLIQRKTCFRLTDLYRSPWLP